jgi:ubiquinone biosynthesis protein
MVSTLRMLPKHIKWFTKELSKSQYAFELKIRDADKHVKSISKSLYFLGLSMLVSVFVISGVLLMKKRDEYTLADISPLSWVFWGMAAIIMFRSMVLKKY